MVSLFPLRHGRSVCPAAAFLAASWELTQPLEHDPAKEELRWVELREGWRKIEKIWKGKYVKGEWETVLWKEFERPEPTYSSRRKRYPCTCYHLCSRRIDMAEREIWEIKLH